MRILSIVERIENNLLTENLVKNYKYMNSLIGFPASDDHMIIDEVDGDELEVCRKLMKENDVHEVTESGHVFHTAYGSKLSKVSP